MNINMQLFTAFPLIICLTAAAQALDDLRHGRFEGAAVIDVAGSG